jgi:hypothetical protein
MQHEKERMGGKNMVETVLQTTLKGKKVERKRMMK